MVTMTLTTTMAATTTGDTGYYYDVVPTLLSVMQDEDGYQVGDNIYYHVCSLRLRRPRRRLPLPPPSRDVTTHIITCITWRSNVVISRKHLAIKRVTCITFIILTIVAVMTFVVVITPEPLRRPWQHKVQTLSYVRGGTRALGTRSAWSERRSRGIKSQNRCRSSRMAVAIAIAMPMAALIITNTTYNYYV